MKFFSFRLKKKKEDGKKDSDKPLSAKTLPSSVTSNKRPTLDDIPDLLDTISNSVDKKRKAIAIKRVYDLCDANHTENRVPMVCSGKYDVLTPLTRCLLDKHKNIRILACLALTNLSIPRDNQHVMTLGPSSKAVIGGLCQAIENEKEDAYMYCICLMNLSLFEPGIIAMLRYSRELPPLENPNSLLRILEKLIIKSDTASMEQQWACGLLKNLAKNEDNAELIGKTQIPKRIVQNICARESLSSHGRKYALVINFSTTIILNLARWPRSREALILAGAVYAIESILAEGEIHGRKVFSDAQRAYKLLTTETTITEDIPPFKELSFRTPIETSHYIRAQ